MSCGWPLMIRLICEFEAVLTSSSGGWLSLVTTLPVLREIETHRLCESARLETAGSYIAIVVGWEVVEFRVVGLGLILSARPIRKWAVVAGGNGQSLR